MEKWSHTCPLFYRSSYNILYFFKTKIIEKLLKKKNEIKKEKRKKKKRVNRKGPIQGQVPSHRRYLLEKYTK
jgi:hypothetical protein